MNKDAISYVIETTDPKGQTFDGETFTYASDKYSDCGDAYQRAWDYTIAMASSENKGFIFKLVKVTFMGVKVSAKREVMLVASDL